MHYDNINYIYNLQEKVGELGYQFHESFGHLTSRASKAIGRRLQSNFNEAGLDITIDQWVIMVCLWEEDGRRQHELAGFSNKDKVSITRIVDQLERKNYVVRVPDQLDKRNKRVYLTDAGKQMKDEITSQAERTLSEAEIGITEEQVNVAKEVLRNICINLGDLC